jgi:hypothetical protein
MLIGNQYINLQNGSNDPFGTYTAGVQGHVRSNGYEMNN